MCRRARIVSVAIFVFLFHLQIVTCLADPGTKSLYDLPEESLAKALRDFAIQAHCNISYVPSLVAGIEAPAIKGEYLRATVLSMMLAGTRLTAVNIDEDTIQVVETTATSKSSPTRAIEGPEGNGVVRLAFANLDATPAASTGQPIPPSDSSRSAEEELEEITVTGTHIRGTKDLPSPTEIYTRADIDATGAATVQQFLQTLTQNFNGGASENTINAITGSGQTNNPVNGSAPNLRGLGTDATLVLVNGHRVAPGSNDGSFVDVSMIPLSALERVEIVTDGASAIYGSDAVGGVVNFILRSKFDGAESRLQAGSVSTGAKHDIEAAQTVGHDWQSGSAVLSYQYFDQTPLSASSRDYLHGVPLPFDLLPEQVTNSVFANLKQSVAPGVDVHGDFVYSHRYTDITNTIGQPSLGYATQVFPSRIDGYSATLGSTVKLPRQSELNVSATYSESDTLQETFETPAATPLLMVEKSKSDIVSLDANLDGSLATLPAGPIQYAVGGQYRREYFGTRFLFPATDNTFYPSREVGAGYLELHMPILGPSSGSGGNAALELTLADRAEHYSDFGSTNNPQIGALWKPLTGLKLRSTYGTSFKAPLLSELNPVPDEVVPIPGYFLTPAPGGTPNILSVFGGNPNLKPEKATTWTVGLDFQPVQLTGFTAKLTYYDIVFKDQIASASGAICTCDVFTDAAILGPTIVNRNPSAALIQQLLSQPTYENFYNVDPSTIGAVYDARYLNLSTVKTRGVDFQIAYRAHMRVTQFETGIDGTYIFAFDDQFTNVAPVTSFLNTPYNPVDLRLRGREIMTRGSVSVGLYLNFTHAYADNNASPEVPVASWTTADAVVIYRFGSDGPLHGLSATFSVTNLADRNPPYVGNQKGFQIDYDGANANALGRYISLLLQKRW